MNQPAIKWSGSKRSQAGAICYNIVKDYDAYREPFCGSCAVLGNILSTSSLRIRFRRFVCSDLNADLIGAWLMVRDRPEAVADYYEMLWAEMNALDSIDARRDYFGKVRDRFNGGHSPFDFIFLMRTTTNGMPRYNAKGEFNNSLHLTRGGVRPDAFGEIVGRWSSLLKAADVEFRCESYENTEVGRNDLMYLDPPYAHTRGMYFGRFDGARFFDWLQGAECDWMLSYDGIAGDDDLRADVPENLYRRRLLLDSGNSSFRRVIGKDRHCHVRESLYLNF